MKPRPLRVAPMFALAHKMNALLDEGAVENQADLADLLGFTRARITSCSSSCSSRAEADFDAEIECRAAGKDPC